MPRKPNRVRRGMIRLGKRLDTREKEKKAKRRFDTISKKRPARKKK